jgi:glycosyltransferase involved in cell wall biosynthesis
VRDKELVEDLPENVILMGYLKGEDLENFYRNARFFVMASRWYEGFPMTILEAARYGKAMIAPDHGGFTEIIHDGDGMIGRLFAPGDGEALEREVVALWRDEEETMRLGAASYDKLRRCYSTEVIAKQWEDALVRE